VTETREFGDDKPLCDHAAALASVAQLQAQLQQQALAHVTSEGEWIELTGALRADALRYRFIRDDPSAESVMGMMVYDPEWSADKFDAAIDRAIAEGGK
jgi:hypothetical protein